MATKDIVELKNNNETIVYPKTTGEAVFLSTGEDLQTFLDNLHKALAYNIIPKDDKGVSIGKEGKTIKEIYVAKIIVGESISATDKTLEIGTVTARTVTATNISGTLTGTVIGNVNAEDTATSYKVWGAVAN